MSTKQIYYLFPSTSNRKYNVFLSASAVQQSLWSFPNPPPRPLPQPHSLKQTLLKLNSSRKLYAFTYKIYCKLHHIFRCIHHHSMGFDDKAVFFCGWTRETQIHLKGLCFHYCLCFMSALHVHDRRHFQRRLETYGRRGLF